MVLVLLVLALARFFGGQTASDPRAGAGPGVEAGDYHVVRIKDGDTILVEPHETVRLIGVNAPESVKPDWPVEPFGPEASQFTKQFLAGGNAHLEFDRERLDQYGRTLAYVWVGDRLLNEELLRAGLGRFEPQYHYSETMKRRFRQAQNEAKRAGRGIWSLEQAK